VNSDGGRNEVDFRRITLPLTVDPDAGGDPVIPQPETAPSFVENFIGSTFNDYIFIDPLSLSGNFPVGSPPVARSVDGNNPSVQNLPGTTDAIPPGDTLDFDSKGKTVLDTGLSLTAVGVGTVAYRDIETVTPFENAPGRVISNTDVGFTLEGDTVFPSLSGWQLTTSAGAIGGTQYELEFPGDIDLARWTFDGVTPGLYRVSATWGAAASTATLSAAAPFTILDGDRAVAQELIDLQSLPDDFTDTGVIWEDIAGLVWISGHSLVVELDPGDGQSVVADSVRIERLSIETTQLAAAVTAGVTTLDVVDASVFPAPGFDMRVGQETVTVTGVNIATNQLTLNAVTTAAHSAGEFVQVERPEIQVQVGNTLLMDGNGELDFGITRPGMAVAKTVRILNSGVGDLTVTAGTLPAGFTTTLSGAAGPATVLPGESLSFGITMTAAAVGDFSGDFLFTTNDLDEDEYSFRVAGSVADSVIVDDEDPTFEILTGDWDQVVGAGFEGDYSRENSVDGGASASWTFSNLVPGRYRVSATWPQSDLTGQALNILEATDQARFQVFDGSIDGTQLADTVLNQEIAPDDITADGSSFEDITTSVSLVGTTLSVLLSNNGVDSDYLLADAIRVERLPDQVLTVTTDGGATTVIDDTGVVSFGTFLAAETTTKTFVITNNSTAGNDITLTGPITPPSGFSLVQSSPFGTDATSITLTPTQSTTFTLQFDTGVSGTVTGRVSIDTNVDVNDPFDFLVTGSADAEVIDNSDAGFAVPNGVVQPAFGFLTPGVWFETTPPIGPVEGSYLAKVQGAGTDVARWTFDVTPGVYNISSTWLGTGNASTAAPYRIYDNGGSDTGGTLLQSTSVNQMIRPNDFLDDNAFWGDLGVPVTVTSNTLVVELNDLFVGGQIVTADAVRIERITDPEITVTNGGASLEDGVSSVNFGVTPSGTPVIQTFIVQNFGARNMFVDAASLAASVAAIPGFSLTTSFTSTEIAPGGSSVFQVQLDGVMAGRFSGTVEFAADDFDEQNFEIQLFGDVLDAAAVVVDDGDVGTFADVNNNLSGAYIVPGTGFGGDALTSLVNSTPAGEATWTFGGLTAGSVYRLSATWIDYLPFMTEVTYNVFAGDTSGALLQAVSIDQKVAPDDFVVGGIAFEELMGPFTLPAGQDTLTVQLSGDIVDSLVVADAIRLDALTMAKITVSEGGTGLVSGNSTVSFGTTVPGTSVTRTITVANDGNAALQLTGVQIPNGFSSTFTPVTVAAGTDTTFNVTLEAAVTGDFFGDIVLLNDDPNKVAFRFGVSGTATNIRVVDNGDVGSYASTGFQSAGAGIGFQLDIEESAISGSATDTATWTFAGLANGVYRVSSTWDGSNASHATNAPFSIYDAATATGTPVTVAIDQSQVPNDFSDDGAFWEDLGVPFNVTSGALTVQLTGLADGFVLADAIRVEPVTTPEIGLTLTTGGANIADGGLLGFGQIAVGAAAAAGTINVTVTNLGVGTLELGNFLVPSTGYTVANLGTSNLIGNGATTTFDILLNTATAGTFAGVISIGTNDSDENPFDIAVIGTISDSTIIDNEDGAPVFTTVGAGWATEGGFGGGFGGNYEANPGSVLATDVATWTFSNLTDAGRYRVSTTWVAGSMNASDATYTLTGGAAPQAVMFNQGLAPENAANATTGTINDRDATFVNIGDIYELAGGTTTLVVTLSAVADGRVLADAVRVELIDDAELKVTQGGTNVQDGGTFDFGTTDTGTSTTTTFTIQNEGAQDLILGTTLALPAGYSLVAATPGTLFDGAASTTVSPGNSVTFDVQLDAAVAGAFPGSISFTSNDVDENPFNISVTGSVVTPVAFDGVNALIIDEGDRGFSSVVSTGGTWFNYFIGEGFNSSELLSFPSSIYGTATATWTATAVSGLARVAATWPRLGFGSEVAEFTIYDGTAIPGNLVATVTANQLKDPIDGLKVDGITPDGFAVDGANWDELGTFNFTSGTITIQLTGGLIGYSVADAIRISASGTLDAAATAVPLPTERHIILEELPTVFDAAISTWIASGQVSADQLIDLQSVVPVVTDLPGTQVGQLVDSVMFLDINAAGNGWFVDQTPYDNSEFDTLASLTQREARGNSHAVGDIDLLTVVLHEFGHVLNKADLDPETNPTDLMADILPTGVRRLPESVNAVASTAPADLVVDLSAASGHMDLSLFDGYLVVQSKQIIQKLIDVSATQTLTVNGTDGADNFRIDLDQSGGLNFNAIVVHGYGDDDEIFFDGVPTAFTGSLTIDGGTGNDQIEVRGGQTTALTLNGAAGDDTLLGGLGAETINGGSGNDILFGGSGNDRINAGAGHDLVQGNTGDDTLVGNDGDDSIMGGAGRDVLTGGAGNDTLSGQGGNDTLLGHDGDDILNGGRGRDALSGGAGNDRLRGGTQNDLLTGGLGNDVIQGNFGHDTLAGDDGDDSLSGGMGSDKLDGGAGTNHLFGQQAVDSLFGASALREELQLNPQNAASPLAAGLDILIADDLDDEEVSSDSGGATGSSNDQPPPVSSSEEDIDADFNIFAEWIDLV
jgi:Ca2+-binding RTX toxin-like protein